MTKTCVLFNPFNFGTKAIQTSLLIRFSFISLLYCFCETKINCSAVNFMAE